jgi:hypothetical protein
VKAHTFLSNTISTTLSLFRFDADPSIAKSYGSVSSEEGNSGWLYDLVEYGGSIHEQGEAQDLQPFD